MPTDSRQHFLQKLPGVDRLLEQMKTEQTLAPVPKSVRLRAARSIVDELRNTILGSEVEITEEMLDIESICAGVQKKALELIKHRLLRTINATGIVVHTNLGRSLLSPRAIENMALIAGRYSNLEFDLAAGRRGSRYSAVEDILCEISGAEAAMVVNNNAGAVLLTLETIARGKEVIVSRGEMVEIGGAFRIPDVMSRSGAVLKEVGTTNRTHLSDYASAIGDQTGLLLKVHTSNYAVVGFSASVGLPEMVALGREKQIPVMEDLGSGTFIDFSKYGLIKEPTVQESIAAGIDVVTFSGDKLLGGPQAGIILGAKKIVDNIKNNPITRALRIDKMTLAALESTLRLYRDENTAVHEIPTLRMILEPRESIAKRAEKLLRLLNRVGPACLDVKLADLDSKAGGGSLPLLLLPSVCVCVRPREKSVNAMEKYLRADSPPVIGRIEEDWYIIDLRTVQEDEIEFIHTAVETFVQRGCHDGRG